VAFVLEDILSLTSLMIAVISGLLGYGHTSELGDEVMRPSPFDLNGMSAQGDDGVCALYGPMHPCALELQQGFQAAPIEFIRARMDP